MEKASVNRQESDAGFVLRVSQAVRIVQRLKQERAEQFESHNEHSKEDGKGWPIMDEAWISRTESMGRKTWGIESAKKAVKRAVKSIPFEKRGAILKVIQKETGVSLLMDGSWGGEHSYENNYGHTLESPKWRN